MDFTDDAVFFSDFADRASWTPSAGGPAQPGAVIVNAPATLLLNDMIQEWDMEILESIDVETRLIDDLGFESVDLMQLIVAIEQTFGVRGLPYEQVLMQDGGYVTEITVRQLTDFLHRSIPLHRQTGAAAGQVAGTRP